MRISIPGFKAAGRMSRRNECDAPAIDQPSAAKPAVTSNQGARI